MEDPPPARHRANELTRQNSSKHDSPQNTKKQKPADQRNENLTANNNANANHGRRKEVLANCVWLEERTQRNLFGGGNSSDRSTVARRAIQRSDHSSSVGRTRDSVCNVQRQPTRRIFWRSRGSRLPNATKMSCSTGRLSKRCAYQPGIKENCRQLSPHQHASGRP